MISFRVDKTIVCCCLVWSYFFLPKCGYTDICSGGGEIVEHLVYPLSHANVWHLAANVVFLWMIPCRMHLVACYACAVVCSFLPCFMSEPTMGFSGVLFAMVGVSWGEVRRFKDMIRKNAWFLVIPFVLPHVNAMVHLYCMVAGYAIGMALRETQGGGKKRKPCGQTAGHTKR